MQSDTIATDISKIRLNFSCSVKLQEKDYKSLKAALKAASNVCSAFSFNKKAKHGVNLKGVESFDLSLLLCGKQKIRKLNREWRNKDYATDVLSFPVHDDLRESEFGLPHELELGDMFICQEVALSQSKEYKVTWEQEIVHLFIHGFLHLLGFDHELSLEEEKIMQGHENALVKKAYEQIGWGKNG
tara:strand:- start:719 stop:1276 length:558 start_codon:yes stop_codon:yes gene_type:complete